MKPQLFWKLIIICLLLVLKLIAASFCVVAKETDVKVPQNTTQVTMTPYQEERGFDAEHNVWISTGVNGEVTTWLQTTIPASGTVILKGFEGTTGIKWEDAEKSWSVTIGEQNQ